MLISTPIFYVNAKPHLGHAYSLLLADAFTRWQRLRNPQKSVILSTGTDEHGQKIHRVAVEKGLSPQEWCDSVSEEFRNLTKALKIVPDHQFIRTTTPAHKETVLTLWKRLVEKGAIYKGKQEGWYCVADEAFYSREEVIEDAKLGPISRESRRPVQWICEDNYRFKLYEYLHPVEQWLSQGVIHPASRANDLQPFLQEIKQNRLELSVSRKRATVQWGIPVPGDEEDQLIYVWIDALANYLATGQTEMTHVIGKDILKFHAVYWPALLTAAELPLPTAIVAHGHWLHDGQKMSKSLGNVVDPIQVIQQEFQGDSDPLRYFLLRAGKIDADGQFSSTALRECYQRELVGSLGNLISRVFKGQQREEFSPEAQISVRIEEAIGQFNEQVPKHFNNYRLSGVADCLQSLLAAGNSYLSANEPWKHQPRWPQCRFNIHLMLQASLQAIEPLMPSAALTIQRILKEGGATAALKPGGLFPRQPR